VPDDPDGSEAARRDREHVRRVDPSAAELSLAERTLGWISSRFAAAPLFARIDLVDAGSGVPVLMEAELIEPSLYLGWSDRPGLSGAEVFAAAVIADLG
jgi:hypothetical protein